MTHLIDLVAPADMGHLSRPGDGAWPPARARKSALTNGASVGRGRRCAVNPAVNRSDVEGAIGSTEAPPELTAHDHP